MGQNLTKTSELQDLQDSPDLQDLKLKYDSEINELQLRLQKKETEFKILKAKHLKMKNMVKLTIDNIVSEIEAPYDNTELKLQSLSLVIANTKREDDTGRIYGELWGDTSDIRRD